MSIVEQAVAVLQRVGAQRPAEPEEDKVRRPGSRPVGGTEDGPESDASAGAISVPYRGDRTVCIEISALRTAGLVAPQDEERQLAAEYRLIKRPLLAGMTGDDRLPMGNVVIVTSALPNEGKTFTTVNLALSLALERDRQVVLVDGDVVKAQLTKLWGLDGEPGLLDLGATGLGFEQTIVKTDYPSLFVLPAGNKNAEATEILRSDRVVSLLASLAGDSRRIVLIDAPPLLVTSEAAVVTSLGGQVVVVVKAADTPRDAVLRAVETIAEDKPVSFVLNQVDLLQVHGYSYYEYQSHGRQDDTSGSSISGHNAK